ncbi:MAG: amidohydrolase [Fidelibacterota bacterium]|nr:MAG: amidohydrolase [Candidatus Neomarinimicrobiota bacterium]
MAVGSTGDIEKLAGSSTIWTDLEGRTVIPGLIDAHLHPDSASTSELVDEIPDVRRIDDLINWIKAQARTKKEGEWIIHPKYFPTRIKEMRWPALEELDIAAPRSPVFLNGTYAGMSNSAAMRAANITKDSEDPGIVTDAETGQLSGLLHASSFHLLGMDRLPPMTYEAQLDALEKMIRRYNQVGLTGLGSGLGDHSTLDMYNELKKRGQLTARIFQNISFPIDIGKSEEEIRRGLIRLGYHTGSGDEWARVGALKAWIDGGILTGTAFLREPWGARAKEIYGLSDAAYRGEPQINKEALATVGTVAQQLGWKFTAHCTGGAGVDLMLDAFEEVNSSSPLKDRRYSIIHGNFYTPEAMKRMSRLGVYADMQPAWFYKDADAMKYLLGESRIKLFHPYKSLFDAGVMVNGGSDHMVKYDSYTAINPYNPFLSMWSTITRKTERGSTIVPEEAITREQALKMYTINNAYGSFEEKIKGSIEPEKLADLVVISEDFLDCPVDRIKAIKAEMTMVGGEIVHTRGSF